MVRSQARPLVAALAAAGCVAAALAVTPIRQPQAAVATREEAYRANNVGVSRLEQYDFDAAAASFRRALTLDPQLAMARLNLGIALFYGGKPEEAQPELVAAKKGMPNSPQPDYVLGLIARGAGQASEAIEAFARVQKLDPDDVGVAINLGQLYRQERKFPEAVAEFRKALAGQPFNATAMYGLANTLVLAGSADEGKAAMEQFQKLSDSGYAVTYSQTYLEQGRYAEAIVSTGAEAPLVDVRVPNVAFTDATAAMLPATAGGPDRALGSVTLADLDGDGDLDLLEGSVAGSRIYINERGRFSDASSAMLGNAASVGTVALVPGDYDNDGRVDIAALTAGVLLLHAGGQGFRYAPEESGFGAKATDAQKGVSTAAWLDADHDGDLDFLFVADGHTPRLMRNNGNGRFTDVTKEAGLAAGRVAAAVVPTDYDNRRDIDILMVAASGRPVLYRNMRDGTFKDVAAEAGLTFDTGAVMAALGDVNKDGYVDLFFARSAAPGILAMSDGRGRFATATAPVESGDAKSAQFLDYDSDGLLDLFVVTARGPRLFRNLGREWTDVTTRALPAAMVSRFADVTSIAVGDVDGDGRADIVARAPTAITVWRGPSGATRSLGVQLAARVSNRSAVGARVEMRAGSLRQQHEIYAAVPAPAPADVIFGLGDRPGADVVRVLWPSGILQAETAAAGPGGAPGTIAKAIKIEELDRKPSSCPYLYTWNGSRFEFITDFLGGGEMGYWLAPNMRNTPDPDEYVRIDGSRLQPRDGKYELRITNELEESLFLDRAELVAIAHPKDAEVHPNEGLRPDPGPFTIYSAQNARPPLTATDDRGRDVLDRVRAIDRRYVDGFGLERVRGYAKDHALVLSLPVPGPSGRRLLLLTGWTDYAFSGDNVAAHQAGLSLQPPALEYKTPDGQWRKAIDDVGMPVGRPQTVAVELTGRVPDSATEVRIRTTMRIYWDEVRVDVSAGKAPRTIERLDPLTAALRWRGFSAEVTPDGKEPYSYDYTRVSTESPWKLLPGRYTREGDVRPLLMKIDDMFVVSRPGDEIALTFDATALAALPAGWTRTFFLYADGFSKEMNLNSSSPDTLLPLPFHGMTRYPYAAPEAFPSTPAHRDYLERYNTRIVPRSIPSVDRALDPDRRHH